MKKWIAVASLILLAACQTAPKLEDDTRYVRLAKVVDVHVYTEAERKEAKAQRPGDSGMGVGIGIGVGTGVGFGGLMIGGGSMLGGSRHGKSEPPQVAYGAKRFTVETVDKAERFEVMSYGNYKIGDCVKLLMGHPTEFARLFDLKAGERCN
jgi:hypothetical protein